MATHQEAGAPKETPAAPQDWLAQEEARAKGKIVEQERQNALDSKMQELERDREGLHSFLYRAGSAYNAILNERSREIDQRDYLGVVNHVQKAVKDAGLNVPADYAENLILARLAKDAELRQAFVDRNKSAQHAKQFGKLVKQNTASAISKVREDQAFAEGAQVTADREAVAQYLRGASTNVSPPERPKDYGAMTDAEWAKEKSRLGIG